MLVAMLSFKETQNLSGIVSRFDVCDGRIDMIESFGEGRINHTYKITIREGATRSEYLLQSINTFVFPDTKALMSNLVSVTAHIRDSGGRSIEYIRCKENDETYVYVSDDGRAWRMYHYIDADVYPCIVNTHHAYMLGEAIADFSKSLEGFDASSLVDTIPDFHNTPKRFNDFLISIANDVVSENFRCLKDTETRRQIEFVLKRKEKLGVLMNALENGDVQVRVTHNDPKLNNVLFDKTDNSPICMIDLDTIMSGTCLFDVGDALRSIANTASEDEKDAKLVGFSVEIFEEFVRGYLKSMREFLTNAEIQLIPHSVWVIAMELGIRFLTDHIDGNKYFKTQYDGQNQERSKIQFRLAEVVEEKIESGELDAIVKKICEEI